MILRKAKGLDYWKKKLLEVLNKAPMEKSLKDILFGDVLEKSLPTKTKDLLIKARGYAPGTIREWSGKKIQNASSMSELSKIVSANMQRFKDENGKTLPIVSEFMKEARGTEAGKKVKEDSVEALTKKFNNLKKLVSKLSESEKDPKEGTMSDKYYKTLREYQKTRDKLNKLEEFGRKKKLASPEYKKEQAKKQEVLDRKEKVKQREREVTSTTHENWKRRQKKQVEGKMGSRGQGKISNKPKKIAVKQKVKYKLGEKPNKAQIDQYRSEMEKVVKKKLGWSEDKIKEDFDWEFEDQTISNYITYAENTPEKTIDEYIESNNLQKQAQRAWAKKER